MRKIYVIGGANVDILARSYAPIIPADSNPGHVSYTFGGVAHNIACNLAKLGCQVEFITAISEDNFGKQVRQHCHDVGMKLTHCQFFHEYSTSLYLAIVQPDGDMNVAIADMEILSHLDVEKVSRVLSEADEDDFVVIDTNLTTNQIHTLVQSCSCRIFADPISTTKAVKVLPFLDKLYFLKPNQLEAEKLSNLPCSSIDGYVNNLCFFLDKGVKNIVISLGKDGVIASNGNEAYHVANIPMDIVNTTGAGDSFMAGFIYGQHKNRTFLDSLFNAMAASYVTLMSNETVNPLMSEKLLKTFHDDMLKNAKVTVLAI